MILEVPSAHGRSVIKSTTALQKGKSARTSSAPCVFCFCQAESLQPNQAALGPVLQLPFIGNTKLNLTAKGLAMLQSSSRSLEQQNPPYFNRH